MLGWMRYFGAANLGIAAGTISWSCLHIKETIREGEKWRQGREATLQSKEAKLQKNGSEVIKKDKLSSASNVGNTLDKL